MFQKIEMKKADTPRERVSDGHNDSTTCDVSHKHQQHYHVTVLLIRGCVILHLSQKVSGRSEAENTIKFEVC